TSEKSATLPRVSSTRSRGVAPVLSTTGLIFENRPRNLPAKDPKEEKRHRQLYQQMIEVAKKKELRDLQEQQKKQEDQSHHENFVVNALATWNKEILPNWDNMRNAKKVLELWWLGLPPSVRGRVWKLAFGNDLHITQELFEIFRCHAEQKLLNNENSKSRLRSEDLAAKSQNFVTDSVVDLITMDVSRTFPSLGIFQKGGPFHNVLYKVLGAYSCYRPDIGYVQGMAFLAAVLLLNMEEIDAFICFANLINRPMQMAFFSVDQPMMRAYFLAFEVHLQDHLPKLQSHFTEQGLTPDLYLTDWIFTLYSKSLPLDVASRVWDLFCRDGDEFLFRTALGILQMFSSELMKMEFITLAQFLTKLPENISEENLFQSIANITITREKFNQVLTEQTQKVLQLYPADKLKQHPTLRK
ncbi:TBC1 domain family member 12 isoform X1, partial [Paramuricea clavata]